MTIRARIADKVRRGRPRERATRRWRCIGTRRRRCSAGWPTRPRAQASRRHRHLHHRPQRQLHERLRREVQLLRVLPRRSDRAKATCSASTRSSGRSTRRSPSAACSCCCRAATTPTCRSTWYEDLFRASRSAIPTFKLHALSPPEVIHLSRLSQLPVPEVIERLIAAGLDSIPGGGAEILVDRVRKLLHCYGKATADEWLDVMRHAHRAGLRTTATMMYGTVETRRGAPRAPAAAARRCRTRPAASPRSSPGAISPSTPSSAAPKRPASTTCARWRSRASCSTTSTTCRRRG